MRSTTALLLLLLVFPTGIEATGVPKSGHREAGPREAGSPSGDTDDSVPDVDLLTLEPKMAKFLVKQVGARSGREARLNSLLDAIFS